jgi:HlyD family secretion protein
MQRYLMIGVVLASVVAALAMANAQRTPATLRLDWRLFRERPMSVEVESPRPGLIVRTITTSGTVEPRRETAILPDRPGKVVAVPVAEGDRVEAGALLVQLDDASVRAQLDTARRGLDEARARLATQEKEQADLRPRVEQHDRLVAQRAAIPANLASVPATAQALEARLSQTRAEVQAAEAAIAALKPRLEEFRITAPFAGRIDDLDVEPGDYLRPSALGPTLRPLLSLYDDSRLSVRAFVDEADAPLIEVGQGVVVHLPNDERTVLRGTVEQVARRGKTAGDRASGEFVGFPTRIKLDDQSPGILPGIRVSLDIEVLRDPRAFSLPVQAVLQRKLDSLPSDSPAVRDWLRRHPALAENRDRSALVAVAYVIEDGTLRARPVETGPADRKRVTITSGVDAADAVVVGPFRVLEGLQDGRAAQVAPRPSQSSR